MRSRQVLPVFVVLLLAAIASGVVAAPPGQQAMLGQTKWAQINPNGFGSPNTVAIWSLAEFNGALYVGARNDNTGGQIWRLTGAGWQPVVSDGFGSPLNIGVISLLVYKGQLYAGTANYNNGQSASGAQIWRSPSGNPGSWSLAFDFSDADNAEAEVLFALSSPERICTATWTAGEAHGAEIWCSQDGLQWTRSIANGFYPSNETSPNKVIMDRASFGSHLFFGTGMQQSEIWRTDANFGGALRVSAPGFGEDNNLMASSLAVFGGRLYAATHGKGQVWRCQDCDGSDWEKVFDAGLSGVFSRNMPGLEVQGGKLYLVLGNRVNPPDDPNVTSLGLDVWVTESGASGSWVQAASGGFDDAKNWASYNGGSVYAGQGFLHVGTTQVRTGGPGAELWMLVEHPVYLPAVLK